MNRLNDSITELTTQKENLISFVSKVHKIPELTNWNDNGVPFKGITILFKNLMNFVFYALLF